MGWVSSVVVLVSSWWVRLMARVVLRLCWLVLVISVPVPALTFVVPLLVASRTWLVLAPVLDRSRRVRLWSLLTSSLVLRLTFRPCCAVRLTRLLVPPPVLVARALVPVCVPLRTASVLALVPLRTVPCLVPVLPITPRTLMLTRLQGPDVRHLSPPPRLWSTARCRPSLLPLARCVRPLCPSWTTLVRLSAWCCLSLVMCCLMVLVWHLLTAVWGRLSGPALVCLQLWTGRTNRALLLLDCSVLAFLALATTAFPSLVGVPCTGYLCWL